MNQENKKYYVTFGANELFPYQDGYLIIEAPNMAMARKVFPERYPNRPGSDCLNFSFIYSEEEWISKDNFSNKPVCDYYKGQEPFDIMIVGEDGHLVPEREIER